MRKAKTQKYKAPFITFEGIDGSGKSVQAELLAKNLKKRGFSVSLLREPGDTSLSEQIRNLLLDKSNTQMHSHTELCLYEAARAQIISEKIDPALNRGVVVICDRFADSTTAYQGYGRELPIEIILQINRFICGDTVPDRTFFLDITADLSLSRKSHMGEAADRMEKQTLSFFERVRNGYMDIAKQDSTRIKVLDGSISIKKLEQLILKDVLLLLKQFNLKSPIE